MFLNITFWVTNFQLLLRLKCTSFKMLEMSIQLILVINKVTRQSSVYLVRRTDKMLDSISPTQFLVLMWPQAIWEFNHQNCLLEINPKIVGQNPSFLMVQHLKFWEDLDWILDIFKETKPIKLLLFETKSCYILKSYIFFMFYVIQPIKIRFYFSYSHLICVNNWFGYIF